MAAFSSRSQCGGFSLAVLLALGSPGLLAQDDAFDLQPGDTSASADYQEQHGDLKFLKGRVEIATDEFVVTGDEAHHNEATGQVEAKGNVRYRHLTRREDIYSDKLSYNVRTRAGTFYKVHGIVESASQGGPRLLSTDNPFYIEGEIVYKAGGHYTVHKGYVTNCEVDNPWWTLRSPKTKIVLGGHATIHRGVFRMKGIPLFYFPYFRKSLKRLPRQSGFLTPNIGNSSRFGLVLGQSYYWAINRSYDATIGGTWFSDRGIATRLGFRGRPTRDSYFGASFYGVQDRGFKTNDGRRIKQGGSSFEMEGAASMPGGFRGVAQLNYLSSLEFRQAFTQSFAEAVQSQMRSIGFMSKDISTFSMNVSLLRGENFQSVRPDDKVILRKLPSLEFNSRDRRLFDGPVPLWFSLDSSFGLVSRTQETFQTSRFVQRGDIFPRLTSSFQLAEFQFTPSFGIRHTAYGQRREQGSLQGMNFSRNSREFSLDIAAPSFQRIFEGPKWLGDRVKHVIEPRIRYRFVDGIDNFDKVIRFDGRDLLTNTNEADLSVMNRLYVKDAATGRPRSRQPGDLATALFRPGIRRSPRSRAPQRFQLDRRRLALRFPRPGPQRFANRVFVSDPPELAHVPWLAHGLRPVAPQARQQQHRLRMADQRTVERRSRSPCRPHPGRVVAAEQPAFDSRSAGRFQPARLERRGTDELRLPTEHLHLQRHPGHLQHGLLRLQLRMAAVRDRPNPQREPVPRSAVDRQCRFVRHSQPA